VISFGRSDEELFDRSVSTLVRSWVYLASGSPGAEVTESDGATIAVFIHSPDREFLNNTVLPRGVGSPDAILDLAERAYADRGVERHAVWVHESEAEVAAAVRARGYAFDSSTRTKAMEIDQMAEYKGKRLDLVEPSPSEFWRVGGLDGLAPELSPQEAHFYVARLDGEDAAMLMAFDHDGDCGIYMVGTVPTARRRGLATALSAHAVADARERGCTTVSLQSTEMAEGVYARVGFRDLGRFDEYVSIPEPGPDQSKETK
jgi:GNAT superfamily N-acetyltransferase